MNLSTRACRPRNSLLGGATPQEVCILPAVHGSLSGESGVVGGGLGGWQGGLSTLSSLPLPFPLLFPEKVWMWAPVVPGMGDQCSGWASLSGRMLSHPRRPRDPALAWSGPGRCAGGGVAGRHTLVSDLTPGRRHGRGQCWQQPAEEGTPWAGLSSARVPLRLCSPSPPSPCGCGAERRDGSEVDRCFWLPGRGRGQASVC